MRDVRSLNEGGSGGAECGREWVNATGVGAQRVVGFGGRMVGTIGEAI